MVYITGDTHGEFDRIADFCAEYCTTEEDVLIILGDVVLNYYLDERDTERKYEVAQLPITLLCVHGNHEERPYNISGYEEKKWNGGRVWYEEEYPNILFAEDGEIYDLEGNTVMAIGGAYSVDKHYRLYYGLPWFPSEQPDKATKEYVEKQLEKVKWKVDYIVSHTCPEKYEPTDFFLPTIDQSTVDKSTEKWLDKLEEKLDYKRWYFGHFHCDCDICSATAMFNEIVALEE